MRRRMQRCMHSCICVWTRAHIFLSVPAYLPTCLHTSSTSSISGISPMWSICSIQSNPTLSIPFNPVQLWAVRIRHLSADQGETRPAASRKIFMPCPISEKPWWRTHATCSRGTWLKLVPVVALLSIFPTTKALHPESGFLLGDTWISIEPMPSGDHYNIMDPPEHALWSVFFWGHGDCSKNMRPKRCGHDWCKGASRAKNNRGRCCLAFPPPRLSRQPSCAAAGGPESSWLRTARLPRDAKQTNAQGERGLQGTEFLPFLLVWPLPLMPHNKLFYLFPTSADMYRFDFTMYY